MIYYVLSDEHQNFDQKPELGFSPQTGQTLRKKDYAMLRGSNFLIVSSFITGFGRIISIIIYDS